MAIPKTNRDLTLLAPKFALRVLNALNECWHKGLDPIVWEGLRSEELQKLYFDRGVSKAESALSSWHAYGLAVDVISKKNAWNAPQKWWEDVAAIFKANGCDWGGDWKTFKDLPHFQFGRLRASPSHVARRLYAEGGKERVWREVGAA